MTKAPILDSISHQAAQLVAERLRSTAVAIARLEPLIAEANDLGHTHVAILEAIKAGGLDTSMNNYKVYLHRARQSRSRSTTPSAPAPVADFPESTPGGTTTSAETNQPADASATSTGIAGNEGSVTDVRDSLLRAKQTATRDYSKIVRNQLRKPK